MVNSQYQLQYTVGSRQNCAQAFWLYITEVFLLVPMHMTPIQGHTLMMYCQLEPLKSLYIVTGVQKTQIFEEKSLVFFCVLWSPRAKKVVHTFAWNPLEDKVLHNFAWTPLYYPNLQCLVNIKSILLFQSNKLIFQQSNNFISFIYFSFINYFT